MISYAAEIAPASAADWFWRLIAYHSPVSAPRLAKPINAEIVIATSTKVVPLASRSSRRRFNCESVIAALQAGHLPLVIGCTEIGDRRAHRPQVSVRLVASNADRVWGHISGQMSGQRLVTEATSILAKTRRTFNKY